MFCPQCGTESPADLKFCRMCGANLRVIGKAVTLSEAIARSDSVPSKIKDLVRI
ncbi:MAG: double zinc ribbon domain-containing protein [Pyrinomonadaceae bacterium]